LISESRWLVPKFRDAPVYSRSFWTGDVDRIGISSSSNSSTTLGHSQTILPVVHHASSP